MTTSYLETKRLVDFVLTQPKAVARDALHLLLSESERSEPEFCAGVIEHARGLSYSSDQWFDLFLKVPNMLFQHERHLMNKLTPEQRSQLHFE